MAKLIDEDALVAEIERLISIAESQLALFGKEDERNRIMWAQQKKVCELFLSFINTLEVKEVDLEKELEKYCRKYYNCNYPDQILTKRCSSVMPHIVDAARHFYELGIKANNPIVSADRGTAEEIIINLKKIESDYNVCLTKEIEWVRKQVGQPEIKTKQG